MKDTKLVRNAIIRECNAVMNILVEKNIKYGNSAIDPVRIFSTCDPDEQLNVRIDDKLSRVKRGQGKDDEDVSLDLIGYLILKRVYKLLKDSGWDGEEEAEDGAFFAEDDDYAEETEEEEDERIDYGNLGFEGIRKIVQSLNWDEVFDLDGDWDAPRLGHRGHGFED